jgi:hypothetical protein
MIDARTWRSFVFCCCGLGSSCAFVQPACAASGPSLDEATASAPLARVEIATVGDVERDPLLFQRIRSLFPEQTSVVLSAEHHLDQRAVLRPRHADTVYIWIRVTELSAARVYLTLAEQDGQARYLFREVRLDSGLDEVGGETLAQVAHSSAQALWSREQQSSREALVDALAREAQHAPLSSAATTAPVLVPTSVSTAHDSPEPTQRSTSSKASPVRLGIGASGSTHSSGSEGFLQEVGGSFGLEYRGWFSLRSKLSYLVPTDFGVPPARVHLTGATGELRTGWLSNDSTRLRVRLEAGLGALVGRAQGSIIDDTPKAHSVPARDVRRGYALAAAGLEWPVGPAWVAAAVDLRVPFGATSYEVAGQMGSTTSASVCPGGSLEIGFGFDPAPR